MSDDLIEDLEVELGNTRIRYMDIHIKYSHSCFPQQSDADSVDGVSAVQSKVETLATASLKLHNTRSPWSPPPAPTTNPLFHLIERHWGREQATEAMRKMMMIHDSLENPAGLRLRQGMNDICDMSRAGTTAHRPPVIPARRASLQKRDLVKGEQEARGPWTEITWPASRSTTPGSTKRVREPSSHGRGVPSIESDVDSHPVEAPGPGDAEGSSMWKRRSFGTETLRGILPLIMGDLSSVGRERQPSKSGREGLERIKSRKEISNGRWGWGGWF